MKGSYQRFFDSGSRGIVQRFVDGRETFHGQINLEASNTFDKVWTVHARIINDVGGPYLKNLVEDTLQISPLQTRWAGVVQLTVC